MKKSIVVIVGALAAATSFGQTAYARHRVAPAMAAPANPRVDKDGQFYATPMQAGAPALGMGMGTIPGLGIANGVVNGVAQPLLLAPGTIVNGVTQPLLAPLS